jgi:hypothetical protein
MAVGETLAFSKDKLILEIFGNIKEYSPRGSPKVQKWIPICSFSPLSSFQKATLIIKIAAWEAGMTWI